MNGRLGSGWQGACEGMTSGQLLQLGVWRLVTSLFRQLAVSCLTKHKSLGLGLQLCLISLPIPGILPI
jgi:hypothetical protein